VLESVIWSHTSIFVSPPTGEKLHGLAVTFGCRRAVTFWPFLSSPHLYGFLLGVLVPDIS
jgi:hypothetical protein